MATAPPSSGDRGSRRLWGAVLDSELVNLAGGQQPLYAVFAPTAAPRRAPFSINGKDRLGIRQDEILIQATMEHRRHH
jgi:hypothetical protein